MNIGVLGLGFVGLTLSIAAAENEITVYGSEINEKILESLKNNKAHFFEPGLDDLIGKHNHKNFYAAHDFPTDVNFDAFIITVGTPLKQNSTIPNFDYIKEALNKIAPVYDGSQVVILRSTVSVGTTRKIVIPTLKSMPNLKSDKIFVAMCPERTVEGKAIEELKTLPQIISGNNDEAIDKAEKIFGGITSTILRAKSLEEAELAKLYCNTYRDITFAIGNVFSMAAQNFGVDGVSVINLANEKYSRAHIAIPGFVAGPCLEKDAYLLTNNMEESVWRDFLLNGRVTNDALEDAVVNWTQKENPLKDKIVVLSGLAFKGRPETSDLRGSPSLRIASKLKSMGFKLRLHDFVADTEEMSSLDMGEVFADLNDAVNDSTTLLVLNNHPNYETFELSEKRKINLKVLDAWSVCKKLRNNRYVKLYSLGNIMLREENL